MEIRLCILFAMCVYGYPTQPSKNSVLTKNYKKYVSTVADIKLLEREIWRATSNGDIKRALHLESRLEGDVLRAAIGALAQIKKDPIRSKRDLRELGVIVRRDKRTVQMLSSMVASGTQEGLRLLLSPKLKEEDQRQPEEQILVRRTRQHDSHQTITETTTTTTSENREKEDDLANDVIPATTTVTADPTGPTTTFTNVLPVASASTNDVVVSEPSAAGLKNRDVEIINTFARQEEQTEEDEEDEGGGIGGLITSFLGSLSTPEGGVDLDAVTGLLGGLSTQNEDGTFDFTGLQDSVGSLFGGGDEGGSNVGAFLGGLLGAIFRGSAGDAGAKGAGRLFGSLLAAILPGISAYPTPEEGPDGEPGMPKEGLNSAGFFKGLLTTLLSALAGTNSNSSHSNGGHHMMEGGMSGILQIKFKLFKAVFSLITKILGSSSQGKNHTQQH